MKQLTLSVIIPVYNEEDHLGPCLEALAKQTVKPLEVIVVDNNCTDGTVAIAKRYKFVRIVRERRQGRTAARDRGFNAAKGDILGRIDADSLVAPDWVERVSHDFQDPKVAAVTGPGRTRVLIGVENWYSTFWSQIYFWTTRSAYGITTLWGANMALRRSVWQQVKNEVCTDENLTHEDQDLAFLIAGNGGHSLHDNKLLITTNGSSYLYWPKFWHYMIKNFAMLAYHRRRGTLKNPGAVRINRWRTFPSALLGWGFSFIFVIYSLICWPIIAGLLFIKPDLLHKQR